MKKLGIIVLGIIILAVLGALTLVFEVIEWFIGAIIAVIAAFFLGILYSKISNKLD